MESQVAKDVNAVTEDSQPTDAISTDDAQIPEKLLNSDLIDDRSSSGEDVDQNTHSESPSSVQSSNEKNMNCHSEYDARAAAMRLKIEQKLEQIEAEMLSPHTPNDYDESELFEENDDSKTPRLMSLMSKRSRSYSLAEMKETAIARLQQELDNAQKELKLKDEEVAKLSKVRNEMGAEIEDLTASLFEEANNMVQDANIRTARAERQAKEANMKLSILQEEVTALKALIQATMPLIPRYKTPPLQQQLRNRASQPAPPKKSLFGKNPTNITPPANNGTPCPKQDPQLDNTPVGFQREQYEPDPILHAEFVSWRQNPVIDKQHPFLKRIYEEDINPCMNFENRELACKVLSAIEANKITMERVPGKGHLPKVCALLNAPRFCHYKMNLDDKEDYFISTLSRNRIASICDFFCYLRYIEKGLIKHSIHEVYLEILRKRNAITVARLGIMLSPSLMN